MRTRAYIVGIALTAFGACGTPSQGANEPVYRPAQPAEPTQPLPSVSAAPLDVQTVNEAGQEVDLAAVLAEGKVTVVEFYADWCKPCKEVERRVLAMMDGNERIALRKVNVGEDNETPVARQHKIKAIPSVLIFDDNGQLRYTLEGKKSKQAAEIAGQLAR